MSINEKIQSLFNCKNCKCKEPTKMSKIQCNLGCEVCKRHPTKVSINEGFQACSNDLSTNEQVQSKCQDCKCKAHRTNISTNKQIQASCQDCKCKARRTSASTNERTQPLNLSGGALPVKTSHNEGYQTLKCNDSSSNKQGESSCQDCKCKARRTKVSEAPFVKISVNGGNESVKLSCKECECKPCTTVSTNQKQEIQSLPSECEDCECKNATVVKVSLSGEMSKPFSLKISANVGIQMMSSENCESKGFHKNVPIYDKIQSLNSSFESLPVKISSKDELHTVDSENCEDQEIQNPTLYCDGISKKKCSCGGIQLVSLSSNNVELFAKPLFDDQSSFLNYKAFISDETTCKEISTDEEIQSRSSSSETLPTNTSAKNSPEGLCCKTLSAGGTKLAAKRFKSQITMGALSPLDPSSYSRPEQAIIKHISLLLNVDFETHVLTGQATIDFEVLQDINDLILDASNLTIESIETKCGSQLQYKLGDHVPNMGSKLTILLSKQLSAGDKFTVKIKYSTDPQASALQWLDPEQTSGKKHPYLFSQCQPIHARSILPCQDTPAVKFTYDAEVTAPEEFTVLMSALRGETKNSKTSFRQPMPLPSYLVAIAVGVLESRTLGPRSKVWSEKEEIERSAWEFAETEKYLQAAEKLCGPYEWTQYDLLVLPPSFPYGGMENPCLTFVTPTLLAGDRSQADVIVHEIMHSWTGNLVTNRNFEHFWLNEGFTVFLERKVGASLINDAAEAKKNRDFQSLLGLQELNEAIEVFGSSSPLTNLVVNLTGIHPDDSFSRVPYEKGSLFLRYLEDLVGGPEVFDDFLRSYLTAFRKKSLDTDQFKAFLLNYFKDNEELKNIDWDTWLYKSGMPPIIPAYDTTKTKAISALIVKIDDPTSTLSYDDVKSFCPHQLIHLLQQLIDRPALSLERLTAIGTEYKLNAHTNSEIKYRWLRLCVRSKDQTKISEVFNFVNNQGRMKYVRPLYRDLYAWEDVREQAITNFLNNEKYMMHVSAYTLRKDLHLDEKTTE